MANIQERVSKEGKKSYRVLVRRKGQPLQTMTFIAPVGDFSANA